MIGAELARLYALVPRGAELGLSRMRAACARFGAPESRLRAVHVAGTNGKGSVCAFVEAAARAEGLRVGMYTSPHLCRFAERIRVGGEPIADEALAPLLAEVLDGAPELTFFEAATLTAFLAFDRAGVDLAVVEVGLGGRLDATNVLPSPAVTAITSIGFDHVDRLGDTLGAIALEKAGIAKRKVPLVVGPLPPEALSAIERHARDVGAETVRAEEDAAAVLLTRHGAALAGAHQADNARVAAAVAARAGIGEPAIVRGLAEATWPGRLESLTTNDGPILLDAAHNAAGASALADHLDARGLAPEEVALVFGVMADKQWREMLATLAPRAAHRVYVTPGGRRAADPGELARAASGDVVATVGEALARARARVGPDGLVVVAGSIFLVGEARALLLALPRDPPVAL